MEADGGSSDELDAEFFRLGGSFFVQIVEDFHVIGDKADGLDDHALYVGLRVKLFDAVANIGLEPGLLRRSGTALIDQFPIPVTDGLADQSGGFSELQFVARIVGHRLGDAVCREQDRGCSAQMGIEFGQCTAQAVGLGLDELGMVEPHAGLFDHRCIGAGLDHGSGDVFAVLAATAVAAEHRGEEGDSAFASVLFHRFESVR